MPSGMEMMARNMLKMFGIEPDVLIKEFGTRVGQFEKGLETLNKELRETKESLARLEAHFGTQPPTREYENGIARIGNQQSSNSDRSAVE